MYICSRVLSMRKQLTQDYLCGVQSYTATQKWILRFLSRDGYIYANIRSARLPNHTPACPIVNAKCLPFNGTTLK